MSVPHCQNAVEPTAAPKWFACPLQVLPGSRPMGVRGELVMSDQQSLVPAPRDLVSVTTCWMCGIRLSAGQMVADGGSACPDLRWYCLDMRGCTERWTSRPARPMDIRHGTAGNADEAEQAANLPRRRPVSTGIGSGDRSR